MITKSLWRVPVILAICVLVFFACGYLARQTDAWLTTQFDHHSGTLHFFFKLYIILISLGIMTVLGKGNLSLFGFRSATGIHWGSVTWRSAVILATSFFMMLVVLIAYVQVTDKKPGGFPNSSLVNEILSVWIWSSLSEEIFTRGLLQSYLDPLKHFRFTIVRVPISLPVLVSALFFSAMHLSLVNISPVFGVVIVGNTFVMGLVASYYREKSTSLLPPLLIHVMANVIGYTPNIIILASA